MRKVQFVDGEYYHIYNRGVDKREVFLSESDYIRFLRSMKEFNRVEPIGSLYEKDYRERKVKEVKPPIGGLTSSVASAKLVEIICYCLNPNHYHFIVKQLQTDGISKFIQKVATGYTMYFNKKYRHSGSLFQGKFKSIHIASNEYLLWLSAYVNANAQIHGIAEKAEKYPWCSCSDYIGLRKGALCDKKIILDQFKDIGDYKHFVQENIPVIKEKKDLAKYLLE